MRAFSRCFVFAALIAAAAMTDAADAPKLVKGDAAPDVVLGWGLDGKATKVSDYAGKIVVVEFWASWCSPCRKELPLLNGLQVVADQRHLGLQVVAVNIEERDTFRKIARKLGDKMSVRLVNAREHGSATTYGVKGIPYVVIVGTDGRIVQVHVGYGDKEIDKILDEINGLLNAG